MKHNAVARIVIYSLIIVVLLGILVAGLGLDLYAFRRDSHTAYTPGGEVTVDADDVSRIELNWAAGSITIQTGDADGITFSDTDDGKYPLSYSVEGGKLSIDYTAKSFIGVGSLPSKDLTITVPADWVCKSLDLDGAALEIYIDGLTVQNFDIDGAANEIEFSGSLQELDCDGAACTLTLTCMEAPDRIDLDGASVEMCLLLPKDCGFQADISGLSCSFRSDLPYSYREETYYYGDKHCKISIDGLSCALTINELP